MVCDSLTKDGHERIYDRMIEMLNTGVLRLNATPGSELQKLRQQKQRKDSKLLKKSDKDADAEGNLVADGEGED